MEHNGKLGQVFKTEYSDQLIMEKPSLINGHQQNILAMAKIANVASI